MKSSIIITAAALALFTFLFSCKKTEVKLDAITEKTNIIITTPHEKQIFNNGDTIFVKATITCPAQMHGCEVFIIKNGTDTLFSQSDHTHGNEMIVDLYWLNNLTVPASLQLLIAATVDHDGATISKTAEFETR